MTNKEIVAKAREMVGGAVQMDLAKLQEAAKCLHQYLFATKQPVDFYDPEMMEVFDLFQVTHQLLSIAKQRAQTAKPKR